LRQCKYVCSRKRLGKRVLLVHRHLRGFVFSKDERVEFQRLKFAIMAHVPDSNSLLVPTYQNEKWYLGEFERTKMKNRIWES